jgi:hypothetical protein
MAMTLLLNSMFASCIISFPSESPFAGKVNCDSCDSSSNICICNFTSNIVVNNNTAINSLYAVQNCDGYTVKFHTNNRQLSLNANFDFSMETSNFIDYLIISNSTNILIGANANNIKLPNLILESGKTLNILSNYSSPSDKSYALKIKSISVENNSVLNIKMLSTNGISRGRNNNCGASSYPNGSGSGHVSLDVNYIENYGNINIDLNTGIGGDGEYRDKADCGGSYDQSGGHGGNSGNIDFNVNYISNYQDLIINLKTGNGGTGGYSSIDDSSDETFNGGNGGSGGYINIKSIKEIGNYNVFKLYLVAGDGGMGAMQRADKGEHCQDGKNGNGGSGGNISDVNITSLLNKSSTSEFQLNIKNGALAKTSTISDDTCVYYNDATFGQPGKLGNLNINYLENNSSNFEFTSIFNFTNADYQLAQNSTNNGGNDVFENAGNMRPLNNLNLKLSGIDINNLKNGSFLPKNITANIDIFDIDYFYNTIKINGCYINPTSVNYNVNGFKYIFATNKDAVSSMLGASGIDVTYKYCPYCEIIDLDNSINRYTGEYNLYSNKSGTIAPEDLKIFYSYDTTPYQKYITKRADGRTLPVYINKVPIIGELNEDLNMYVYKITKNELKYYGASPDEDLPTLVSGDYLYCYGQEYYLDGKIGNDRFEFPFIPLNSLFNQD